jgi:hypothetical protein
MPARSGASEAAVAELGRPCPPARVSAVHALMLVAVLRVVYTVCGAVLAPRLILQPHLVNSNSFHETLMPRSDALYPWLGVWQRFDTLWYVHIAQHGYDHGMAVVFYPLFPILAGVLSLVFRNPLISTLVISTVAAFFLFWGFERLFELDLPRVTTRRAAVLLGVWPASFIFFAGYPESLVLAFIIWAVYFARRDKLWIAAGLCFVAGLTKAVGILAVAPVAWIVLGRRPIRAAPLIACCLGPAVYAIALKFSGLPLPSESYTRYWGTSVSFPIVTLLESIRTALTTPNFGQQINLILFVLVFASALLVRIRPEYTIYTIAAITFVLLKRSDPEQQQWARYALVAFPAFPRIAAYLSHPSAFWVTATALFALNLLFMWVFFEWSLVV